MYDVMTLYGMVVVVVQVSVWGYPTLSPALSSCFGLRDTCGVHNLHGMPGIMGAVAARPLVLNSSA